MELKNGQIVGETTDERVFLANMLANGIPAEKDARDWRSEAMGELAENERDGAEAIIRGLIREAAKQGPRVEAVAVLSQLALKAVELSTAAEMESTEKKIYATLGELEQFAKSRPEYSKPNSSYVSRTWFSLKRRANDSGIMNVYGYGSMGVEIFSPESGALNLNGLEELLNSHSLPFGPKTEKFCADFLTSMRPETESQE